MELRHNSKLGPRSRELRKSMTPEEKHLWYDFLREHRVKFWRQRVIGNYIADFYCREALLVIELDGSQHFEEGALEYDDKRTEEISTQNIEVIRFTNDDIRHNFDTCCEMIDKKIEERMEYVKTLR